MSTAGSSSAAWPHTATAPTAPSATPQLQQQPFASITRILLMSQPSVILRTLTQTRFPRVSGPMTLLLFLFSVLGALLMMVRAALIQRVKTCLGCRGFGIQRCRLCDGEGKVDWKAKFSYSDMCPLCAGKRYVVCNECGGFHHRPMFAHIKRSSVQAPNVGLSAMDKALD